MRFHLNIMGVELFSVEFAWPARGVYPVPDNFYSEAELDYEFDGDELED